MNKLLMIFAVFCLLLSSASGAATRIDVLGLFHGKAVLKVHGNRRVLSEGQSSPEGIKLLKANSEFALVEVDGVQMRLTMTSTTGIGTTYKSAEKASVRILPDQQGMYFVPGRINHSGVRFLVDTGASLVAMSATFARKLGIDYRMEGTPSQARTASGVAEAFTVTLKQVQVGQIQVPNVQAMVVLGDYPQFPLLGNSFLEKLEIERDGRMMLLRRKY